MMTISSVIDICAIYESDVIWKIEISYGAQKMEVKSRLCFIICVVLNFYKETIYDYA